MGVLRNAAELSAKAVETAKVGLEEVARRELERTKKQVDVVVQMFPTPPCELVTSAADNVKKSVDQLLENKDVKVTRNKLYKYYCDLLQSMEQFIMILNERLMATPAMMSGLLKLKESHEKIVKCVEVTFEKLDDGLVTPVVSCTVDGMKAGYVAGTDLACAKYDSLKTGVSDRVASLCERVAGLAQSDRVTGIAQCATSKAIQTGAYVDKRLSVLEHVLTLLEKSKELDGKITSGRISNEVGKAIEKVKELDNDYINGKGQDLLEKAIDEFQEARGCVGTPNMTVAGAPVLPPEGRGEAENLRQTV